MLLKKWQQWLLEAWGQVDRKLLPVDSGDNPFEEPLKGGLGDGLDGELDLSLGLSLGDVVTSNLKITISLHKCHRTTGVPLKWKQINPIIIY